MAAYKRYKVTDLVQNPDYTQWISRFVQKVLRKAKIEVDMVEIIDIWEYKRIFLRVDGKEYLIRTWEYVPTYQDEDGLICGADVRFMFSEAQRTYVPMAEGGYMGFFEPIVSGIIPIAWNNDYLEGGTPFLTIDDEE